MSEPMDNDTVTTPAPVVDLYQEERFKELMEAGVFYGRKRTKTNPKTRPYILATRNDIEIIDLEKTLASLEEVMKFLSEKIKARGTVLVVGTQPQAVEGVLKLAKEFGLPFVTVRWLGGLLTNFKVLSKRIEYYKKLKSDLKTGGLEKYTKKERLGFEKETVRMEELFGGLENYAALPDVVLVIDPTSHLAAVREARILKIPVIAYMNTDADPDLINYFVVGNTKARTSVNWFLGKVAETIGEARKLVQVQAQAEAEAEKNQDK
jgi:small subunit ribosomal protein S2